MGRHNTGKSSRAGHSFNNIATAEIPRSTFDRSSKHKTTMRASYLTPIWWDELLPGDTINIRQASFFRLATPVTPIMDEIIMETQYFFIPLRIIWDLYPRFMGEQPNEGDSTEFDAPTVFITGGSTRYFYNAHYLGVPLNAPGVEVSALPFRALNKCYNDWYRDPNLQDKIAENTGDIGTDLEADFPNMRRGKRKDLFTSALPWPQRGDPINLLFDGIVPITGGTLLTPHLYEDASGNESTLVSFASGSALGFDSVPDTLDDNEKLSFAVGTPTNLVADMSGASANTINGLRNAFAVQRLLERDARGGARLKEILKAHFKVDSPDARLDRPEYIGGTKTIMGMQTVHQTNAGIGEVGGIGVGHGISNSMQYSATEHGIVMAICSVRCPISYQQGLPKKFSRVERFDYFWPAFSHLGEQPILNKELYAQGTDDLTADAAVFGYQEAWAQYRVAQNQVSGGLNSEAVNTLDVWQLAEDLQSLPVLGNSFINDKSYESIDRALVVQQTTQFICEFHFDLKHTRPLPTFSTPGLIDHF